jgi:hypothetical protein
MAVKIGIKYCGGCNPAFRREKIEEILRESFPEAHFFHISSGDLEGLKKADVVVGISGCKRGCAVESINSISQNFDGTVMTVMTVISIDEERERGDLVAQFKGVLEELK